MQVSGSGGEAVDPAFYRAASAKQGGGQQTDAAARVSSANAANAGASGADAPASSETGVKVRLGDPARRTDDSPLYGASGRLASETPAASTQDANAQVGSPSASGEAGNAAGNEATADPQSGDAQTTRAASNHDLPASQSTDASTDPSTDASTGKPAQSSSPIKSFTYGTLGLESPEQQSEQKDSYYSAGRWLAAAVTVGGIISLLI
ncbi:protein of unknown function [Paraburkholderia kururiensis]|uniref:hypothetical protein n=1 Tax=Paraburkholderia kururiensis TaxID=984307 RepID=UPI0039A4E614